VLVLRPSKAGGAFQVHGGLGDHVCLLLLLVGGGERAAASYLAALAATRVPGLGLWVTAGPRPLGSKRAQRRSRSLPASVQQRLRNLL